MTDLELLALLQSRKIVLPDEFYSLDITQRHTAFTVGKLSSVEQMKTVLNALSSSLEKGGTFNDFKKQVAKDGIVLPESYLDNVFRTNIQNAYARGRWQEQQGNKDDRPYLMMIAINDSRTRPSHLKLSKIIRHIDDAFWITFYPPYAYRCRCYVVSLTEAQAKEYGITPDDKLPDLQSIDSWDYSPTKSTTTQIDDYAKQQLDDAVKQYPAVKPSVDELKKQIENSSEMAQNVVDRLALTDITRKTLPDVVNQLATLDPTIEPSAAVMANAYAQGQGKNLSDYLNVTKDTPVGLLAKSWLQRAFDSILKVASNIKKRITGNMNIPNFVFEKGQVIGINNPSLFKDAVLGHQIEIINAKGLGVDLSKLGSKGVLLPPDVRLEVVSVNGGIVTLQPTNMVANTLFNAINEVMIVA